VIIVPGIALAGILRDNPLKDPDLTFLTLVNNFLPHGIKGLILCGLFASLMSTLDSIYNSVSTLFSIDIYKKYIRPNATEFETVSAGRLSIIGAFIAGTLFSFVVIYVKFGNPSFPLTHWFNELSYYVKNGFVIIIMAAVFLVNPSKRLVLFTMLFSVLFTYIFKSIFPDMNYFIRSIWIILLSFAIIALPTFVRDGFKIPEKSMIETSNTNVARLGIILALSLIAVHIIFH